jgi:hypothetical protein
MNQGLLDSKPQLIRYSYRYPMNTRFAVPRLPSPDCPFQTRPHHTLKETFSFGIQTLLYPLFYLAISSMAMLPSPASLCFLNSNLQYFHAIP